MSQPKSQVPQESNPKTVHVYSCLVFIVIVWETRHLALIIWSVSSWFLTKNTVCGDCDCCDDSSCYWSWSWLPSPIISVQHNTLNFYSPDSPFQWHGWWCVSGGTVQDIPQVWIRVKLVRYSLSRLLSSWPSDFWPIRGQHSRDMTNQMGPNIFF